ncbi:MAG: flagellar basal body-associated FliL family protein [Tissierellia bacterium]|nr:flagellar basal body-associated FliL family protein [Tissierellia bacterium]
MSKKNVIILILILLLALTLGIIAGIFIFSNDSNPKEKQVKIYPLTLEEMYCNIKDSRRILKIKVTIETTNKETYEEMSQKQFLIRDEINKIVRNSTEEELEGKEGQVNLQNSIKKNLINLFNDENITNIYFDDFIIQ